MAREVRVAILGDSRDFSRAVRNAESDAGRLGNMGGKLAAFGKTAALGLGAAGVGAVALGKGFVDAAVESQKVTAQTNAVIKSMGGASKVTADEVAKLSTQLSLKSGIDDELIQSGSNILLTFGNVRNELGKDNDIFNRANQAALDMSVALGTDMTSAAMQVGKALNDPVAGLSKLKRSGIQFSKQQEDQIKAMAAVGDTAGAQKVMLAELERQFGGSAAAQATAADKLKVAWGNVQEQLGAKLLPVVEKVATWLAAELPGAMDAAGRAFDRIRPFIMSVVAAVRDNWPQIQATIVTVITTVRGIIEGFVSVVTTLWDNFGNNILMFVQRVWPAIQQVIEAALNIIQGIVKTVTALIRGDWSQVWEGIKQIVSGVWNAIQGIIKTALEVLRGAIGIGLEIIGSMMKAAWEGIKNAVTGAWTSIWQTVSGAIDDVIGLVSGMPGRIASFASTMWNSLKEAATKAKEWVVRKVDQMLGPIDEVLGKLGDIGGGIIGGAGKIIGGIPGFAQGGTVPGALNQPRLVLAHGGEQILTRGQTLRSDSGPGGNVVNIYTAADPQAVVEAVSRYVRTNGQPGWNR